MQSLDERLSQYAAYHRDRRNVATHCVGIPLIVLAVAILLARVRIPALPAVSLATIFIVPIALYYLWLDLRLGVVMSVLLALAVWLGQWFASAALPVWLGWGIGSFVGGWILQLLGHKFEGRKPAFVDDLMSLIIGPLFVVAEAAFALGLRRTLQQAMAGKAKRLP
ncbi:MAG TPA: Mpo1-like protein [Steroidobacteraceae bacterium]|nr:Mpo1-like protein [Steroidobacteraceae bacterium]